MKGLLFLCRLALICNVLFLACFIFQRTPDFIGSDAVKGTMIVLGWVLAPFVNLAANAGCLVTKLRKKPFLLPAWLVLTNLFFLLFEFFVAFILPK